MAQAAHGMITRDNLLHSTDTMHAFFARVLLQASAESRARHSAIPTGVRPLCPLCGEKPAAAVALDSWAAGHGYTKLHATLFGL